MSHGAAMRIETGQEINKCFQCLHDNCDCLLEMSALADCGRYHVPLAALCRMKWLSLLRTLIRRLLRVLQALRSGAGS
jgi:hypothetical protein